MYVSPFFAKQNKFAIIVPSLLTFGIDPRNAGDHTLAQQSFQSHSSCSPPPTHTHAGVGEEICREGERMSPIEEVLNQEKITHRKGSEWKHLQQQFTTQNSPGASPGEGKTLREALIFYCSSRYRSCALRKTTSKSGLGFAPKYSPAEFHGTSFPACAGLHPLYSFKASSFF